MEQNKAHIKLIEKLVKASPKFSGNEDLLEDFCSETYQKSYLILQSIEDIKSIEAYMQRVVSSAIMDVLKNNDRLAHGIKKVSTIEKIKPLEKKSVTKKQASQKAKKASKKEVGVSETVENNIEQPVVPQEISFEEEFNIENIEMSEIDTADNISDEIPISNEEPTYLNQAPILAQDLLYVADPKENLEDQVIRKDILENVINLVKQIDAEKPQEQFLTIFYERYFMNKKQKDIASQIQISQAEVSKRLILLSRLIKEKLY